MTGPPERTPAEELRAAAAKVRARAANAPIGPWKFVEDAYNDHAAIMSPESLGWDALVMDVHSDLEHPAAQWASLVHPGLAEPLAAWLEDGAKHYEAYAESHGQDIAERVVYHGISVARVLNGGAA